MAPPRPYWKGYLKLSLVSCPIALYTATSSGERVAFRQINKKTGNRLRQQLVDEGTGDPIDPDDKGRGYEVDKGVYLQVEDEELDAIAIESSHTIDIDSFVPKSEVDERYIDSPYYLVPENKVALEAFAVIRDAMLGKGMVALGRVVLSKRERVIMLQPRGKGLLGATLRYPYEVRDETIYFGDIGDIQIPKDMLALAEHILESKAATFDPTLFHDRYEEAVVAMLNEKRAGMPIPKQRPMPRIVAGTDLMAALRQSIEKAKEEAPKTAAKQAAPGGRTSRSEACCGGQEASGQRKAARTSARCCCRLRAARPRRKQGRPQRKRRRNRRRKSPARGRRLASLRLSARHESDRHGVRNVDEEGRNQRQDDEGLRAGAVQLRHRRHIGDRGRRRAEADAGESGRDHRGLVVSAHHREDDKDDVGDRRDRLDRQDDDQRRPKSAKRPELHAHQRHGEEDVERQVGDQRQRARSRRPFELRERRAEPCWSRRCRPEGK